MPELPEVERVRLSLLPLIGRKVTAVIVRRAGVVERCEESADINSRGAKGLTAALLAGLRIVDLVRHGKQLAIVGEADSGNDGAKRVSGTHKAWPHKAWPLEGAMPENPAPTCSTTRCICVHLGMTGSLIHSARCDDEHERADFAPHAHLIWRLDDDTQLVFDDPRRFGGVWTFASLDQLVRARWSQIGPDALTIAPGDLHTRLQHTSRGLKAALLDQSVVAGLGNIYVDELLFACGLHPRCPARRLPLNIVQPLVEQMRSLLHAAIRAGGSSLRDYVDGTGQAGDFQNSHQVYGRGGAPCVRCRRPLTSATIAGRTTVFCRSCQSMRASRSLKAPL